MPAYARPPDDHENQRGESQPQENGSIRPQNREEALGERRADLHGQNAERHQPDGRHGSRYGPHRLESTLRLCGKRVLFHSTYLFVTVSYAFLRPCSNGPTKDVSLQLSHQRTTTHRRYERSYFKQRGSESLAARSTPGHRDRDHGSVATHGPACAEPGARSAVAHGERLR